MKTKQAAKHTPGPWHREGRVVEKIGCHQEVELSIHVYADTPEEMEANARLIAAAPELLEAAKIFMDKGFDNINYQDWDMLCAAIAKAEGR